MNAHLIYIEIISILQQIVDTHWGEKFEKLQKMPHSFI